MHAFDLGLDTILGLKPVKFKYNGLAGFAVDDKEQFGFIAQDVAKVAPELVKTQMVTLHAGDKEKTEIKVVDYGSFTYVVINAVKDLYKKWFADSAALHHEVASVHRDIASVQAENEALKARAEKAEQENAAVKAYLCSKDKSAPFCH